MKRGIFMSVTRARLPGWSAWSLVLALLAALPVHALEDPGWPRNFHQVEDHLWRGGKIESREQLRRLRDELGVRTVICLARDSLGPRGQNELDWAPELGMQVETCFLGDQPPPEDRWTSVRDRMRAGDVYVHCKWGADRTGAIVSRYRQEVQGWTPRQAFDEALRYGFKPWLGDLRVWMGIERGSVKPPVRKRA
jgi:hypothetical protein